MMETGNLGIMIVSGFLDSLAPCQGILFVVVKRTSTKQYLAIANVSEIVYLTLF